MSIFTPSDTLHRLVKQALDSGEAKSLREAEALYRGYCLCVELEDAASTRLDDQIALLTAVALGSRVFLGGVKVVGIDDAPLLAPFPLGQTLRSAVIRLGGRCVTRAPKQAPHLLIGASARPRAEGFAMRIVYSGWRSGVVPADLEFDGSEGFTIAVAPVLGAALGVSEAFAFVQSRYGVAGRRAVGLSLWNVSSHWLNADALAPRTKYLPSALWLIGLGHLGQAYLWALSALPYADPKSVSLVLQDIDTITPSTWSTSVLTAKKMAGRMKTREVSSWIERRGFRSRLTERLFDRNCKRSEDEPAIALCGLDNALGRQSFDDAGFSLVVEAGLGRGHRDFKTMRLHTLPSSRRSADIWKVQDAVDPDTSPPAYGDMLNAGALDRCGVTLLAGKAVGAPFVGMVAACLALSEVLRLLNGGDLHELIDLDLGAIEHRSVVRQSRDFSWLNPGYVATS